MQSTREEEDRCQPEHQAHAASLASLDDAVWTTVIEFLAMPKFPTDAQSAELLTSWRTLLGLRLLTKDLAALLHPEGNKALWRRLVLQSFDFSVRNAGIDNVPRDDPPTHDGESAENDPQSDALQGRTTKVPPSFLEEDLVQWTKLGIYHRPSQYGFLTTLQQHPPVGVWPECEDAFTLFGDLVRLLQLPHEWRKADGGVVATPTFKYLAAPVEADSGSAFYRFYVMKALGYESRCWHWGRGIGGQWKGFTQPHAFEDSVKKQVDEQGADEESMGDAIFTADDEFAFPVCTLANAKQLYQHISQHCRDWRLVCCCIGLPLFYVGESKAAPHRWIGYVGQQASTVSPRCAVM